MSFAPSAVRPLPRLAILVVAAALSLDAVACGGAGTTPGAVDPAGGSTDDAGGSSATPPGSTGGTGATGGGDGSDDAGASVGSDRDAALPPDDAATAADGSRGDPTDAQTGGGALDPNAAPGGNFDLSLWELQEPVGSPGAPTTILPAQLMGAEGFHDAYFFTDPTDGAMTFWDPENGVTTANSSYPRSELREMTATGAAANWMSTGTNTLTAMVKATLIPDHVAVGQIHLGTGTPSSTKPLLELFYYSSGKITLGIEQTPAGGNEVENDVGSIALGTKWTYVIGLSGNTISLTINGGAAQTFPMSSTFDQEGMYFKAGDYDQSSGSSETVGAKVQFYALTIFHGP